MFVCISYEREKGEREELERLRKTERQTSCHSRKEEWCRRVYWEIKKKKKKKKQDLIMTLRSLPGFWLDRCHHGILLLKIR